MFGKIFKKIPTIFSFAKAFLFYRRIPLFVGWDLTLRCNYDCAYCKVPQTMAKKELTTAEVISGIDQLKILGTRRIHFGGGEVLLRDDLLAIVNKAKQSNIQVTLITNGDLFEKKLDTLKRVDVVKMSFDGPPEVHDMLRQKGSFNKVVQAVSLAKKNAICIVFNTTLSSRNIEHIPFILDFSKKEKIPVKFQLINNYLSGDKDISRLKLSLEQQAEVFTNLIEQKKHNRFIINSFAALRYLRDFPHNRTIACAAGKIYARIAVDGRLYPCNMYNSDAFCSQSYVDCGIKKSFFSLPQPGCDHCLCTTTLELNYLYGLDSEAMVNACRQF